MDNIKKIYQEIERRKEICEDLFERKSDTYYQGKMVAYVDLLAFINSLLEEKPSELEEEKASDDLEEAAEKYAYTGIPDEMKYLVKPLAEKIIEYFKVGAEWQHQKDKYEFSKLKTKEWMSEYAEGPSDFCWHSVDDYLPEIDKEVIVLTDELGTAPIYKIAFGHIVDRTHCSDYNGWNIPGVKFWMLCPTIPKEEENENTR